MMNPLPCSTWNTVFSEEYLVSHSKEKDVDPSVGGMVNKIIQRIENPKYKGYAQLLVEYLVDACSSNPYSVSKENGTIRTTYFGLQRPPIIENYVTLIKFGNVSNSDLFLLHLLPFAITNSYSQCVVNLSNGGEVLNDLISSSLNIKVHR